MSRTLAEGDPYESRLEGAKLEEEDEELYVDSEGELYEDELGAEEGAL